VIVNLPGNVDRTFNLFAAIEDIGDRPRCWKEKNSSIAITSGTDETCSALGKQVAFSEHFPTTTLSLLASKAAVITLVSAWAFTTYGLPVVLPIAAIIMGRGKFSEN